MFTLHELEKAAETVRSVFQCTPQYAWPLLSTRLGTELWVKHENHTPIASFKIRGALIYLDHVRRTWSRPRSLIAATRGNHGQAVAFAASRYGLPATLIVPFGNSREKNSAMRALGAELIEYGTDFDAARAEAIRRAQTEDLHDFPSYHRWLALGAATWAYELFLAVRDIDVLYVPIGLGSGICGAIIARDLLGLATDIVGVQSANAPAYALSFERGQTIVTDSTDTFADGLAVKTPDPAALDFIRKGASRILTVPDTAIAGAVRAYWTDTHNLAEGAGAAALAGALSEAPRLVGKRVAVPLTGGNIDLPQFLSCIGNDDRNFADTVVP